MGSLCFHYDIHDDGIRFYLKKQQWLKGKTVVSPSKWAQEVDALCIAPTAHVLALVEKHIDDDTPPARQEGEGIFLSHSLIAALEEHTAKGLGLPPNTLMILGIDCRGGITQKNFDIRAQWLSGGAIPAVGAKTKGSILFQGGNTWRVPEPLFTIWENIQIFQATDTTDDPIRFRLIAKIIERLPSEERSRISTTNYLTRIRIAHATAFSLRLRTDPEGFHFDPVLFGRRTQAQWSIHGEDAPVSEAESLLPEAMQEVFAHQRFPIWQECRDRYALSDGYYVYVEPPLQRALNVVRKAQDADVETRRCFVRNPQTYLIESLKEELDESVIEHLFIPTEQYSERVRDLGIWQPVILPWLKREPTTWFPERFGILVGEKRLELSPEDASNLREQVEQAIQNGTPFVEFGGQNIPATKDTADALGQLVGMMHPNTKIPDPSGEGGGPDVEMPSSSPTFLVVDENYEDLAFRRQCKQRASFDHVLPPLLKSVPMPHQEDGLAWMQKAWCLGLPGVLLADDMGLGKTLSALTFLCWVRDITLSLGAERRPFLIVAPTGLLNNWKAEHDRHLHAPGLSDILCAYGRELRNLRVSIKSTGRDTDLGRPQLNTVHLREANCILTTYETLRDYHLSFATVPMAVAVYDEMQKVKNPASQLSRAAKTINSDFTLGLTGTPIENRLEDLWAIMDVVYPGCLCDLKGFSQSFKENDIDSLVRLKKHLMESAGELPPVMLRRMKVDHLPGLPEKKVEALHEQMPHKQAKAYLDVITSAAGASGRSMLKVLHGLRSISLHPVHPQQWHEFQDEYISWSARLSCTFRILDSIDALREKALIFLESLEMQEVLAVMLQRRYKLPRLPLLINGAVAGPKRQNAVDAFQSEGVGFDVMILSPKAGGVGLTLTAANHVIHLSRWWNPAVEDQCTDRIYRIGQERDVRVYYPLAVHPDPAISDCSFDLKLHQLLERKRNISHDVLIPPESTNDADTLFKDIFGPRTTDSTNLGNTEIEDIDSMQPIQFENWVLQQIRLKGEFVAHGTPRSGDGGADGILVQSSSGETVIIQCKHRQQGTCDDSPIDDLLRARITYDLQEAHLVAFTNMSFSRRAKERARNHKIILLDREKLVSGNWEIL